MTDKEKIRAKIERLKRWNDNVRESTRHMTVQEEVYNRGKNSSYLELLEFINSLPEEPVSEEFEKIVEEIAEPTILNAYGTKELARRLRNTICGTSVSEDLEEAAKSYSNNLDNICGSIGKQTMNAFKAGARWQKEKNSILPTELGEYINELSKQFPEVSFAKLSRIAVRVVKWQKEQFEKNRLKHCNSITNEQAELEQGFIDQHLDKYQRMPTFLDAIEYGMILQKQKMMAKAIDAHVNYAWSGLDFGGFDWSKTGLDLGDKCKLIIIKED